MGSRRNLIYWRKNIFKVLKSYLSKTPTSKDIPEGIYCYTPVERPSAENGWKYKIKPCPHYIALPNGYNHCAFLKCTTDDMCFDDQVKICGENYGDED